MGTFIRNLKDHYNNIVYPRTSIDAVLGIDAVIQRLETIIRGATTEGLSYGMSEVIDARTVNNRTYNTLKSAIDSVDDGFDDIGNAILKNPIEVYPPDSDFNFQYVDMNPNGGEIIGTPSYKSIVSTYLPIKFIKFVLSEETGYVINLYFYNSSQEFIKKYSDFNNGVLHGAPKNSVYFRLQISSPSVHSSHSVTEFLNTSGFECYGIDISNGNSDDVGKVLESNIQNPLPNVYFVPVAYAPLGTPKLIYSESALYIVDEIVEAMGIYIKKVCDTDYINKTEVEQLLSNKQNTIHQVPYSVINGQVNPQYGDGTAYIYISDLPDYTLAVDDVIYDDYNAVFYRVDEVTNSRYNLIILGAYLQLAKKILYKQLLTIPVLESKVHLFNEPEEYGAWTCDGYIQKSDLSIDVGAMLTLYYGAFIVTDEGNLYYVITSDSDIEDDALVVIRIAGFQTLKNFVTNTTVPTSRYIGGKNLSADWTLNDLGAQVTEALVAGGSWYSSLIPWLNNRVNTQLFTDPTSRIDNDIHFTDSTTSNYSYFIVACDLSKFNSVSKIRVKANFTENLHLVSSGRVSFAVAQNNDINTLSNSEELSPETDHRTVFDNTYACNIDSTYEGIINKKYAILAFRLYYNSSYTSGYDINLNNLKIYINDEKSDVITKVFASGSTGNVEFTHNDSTVMRVNDYIKLENRNDKDYELLKTITLDQQLGAGQELIVDIPMCTDAVVLISTGTDTSIGNTNHSFRVNTSTTNYNLFTASTALNPFLAEIHKMGNIIVGYSGRHQIQPFRYFHLIPNSYITGYRIFQGSSSTTPLPVGTTVTIWGKKVKG